MEEDACGFLYPRIDPEKCIDCGLCLKKCAFQSGYEKRKEFEPFYAYGVRHSEEQVFMESRSGGAFTALSDHILENAGAVYGAGFDEKEGPFYVRHKGAETKEGRDGFRGSKYVQSDLGDVFPEVKERLDKGQAVLFTGTGCQIGALYAYLDKKYDRLYTMDLICHGVPSPRTWKDFLHMREEEVGGRVERAEFRNKKDHGWKAHKESVVIGGKRYDSRIYTKLFYGSDIRHSCMQCPYANKDRVGDITLADFWGHEKAMPGIWDDDKGISLVLVNTSQGMRLWEMARDSVDFVEVTGYPFRHRRMREAMKKPEDYDRFWEDYEKKGFVYCAEKYAGHRKKKKGVSQSGAGQGHLIKRVVRRLFTTRRA